MSDKGLRCHFEKCIFAQPYVEFMGHLMSNKGIAKGHKFDAVKEMPAPLDHRRLQGRAGTGYARPSQTVKSPFCRLTMIMN